MQTSSAPRLVVDPFACLLSQAFQTDLLDETDEDGNSSVGSGLISLLYAIVIAKIDWCSSTSSLTFYQSLTVKCGGVVGRWPFLFGMVQRRELYLFHQSIYIYLSIYICIWIYIYIYLYIITKKTTFDESSFEGSFWLWIDLNFNFAQNLQHFCCWSPSEAEFMDNVNLSRPKSPPKQVSLGGWNVLVDSKQI